MSRDLTAGRPSTQRSVEFPARRCARSHPAIAIINRVEKRQRVNSATIADALDARNVAGGNAQTRSHNHDNRNTEANCVQRASARGRARAVSRNLPFDRRISSANLALVDFPLERKVVEFEIRTTARCKDGGNLIRSEMTRDRWHARIRRKLRSKAFAAVERNFCSRSSLPRLHFLH